MKRILIVDDDPEIVGLLKEYLETRPTADQYVVATAADGIEGLNAAIHQRPDLVILDIAMPRMNGMEVRRAGTPVKWSRRPDSPGIRSEPTNQRRGRSRPSSDAIPPIP